MKKLVQSEEQLDLIRNHYKNRGAHIVRYENVERNIYSIIYGDSRITPLGLADLNNLVEGIVIDDCIELCQSKRQIENPTPLNDCLIKASNFVIPNEIESVESELDEMLLRQFQQVQVELITRFMDCIKTGQFGRDVQMRTLSLIRPLLSKHPQLNEIFNLANLLRENRIEEFANQIAKFNPYLEDLEESLVDELFNIYQEAGILSSLYNTDLEIDELDEVMSRLLSEEQFDLMYSWAKTASVAYQNYFGSKGMSVRLPAQLRYPQIHGIGTPRISYEIYKHIAELHKLTIDTLIRYGGTIEIYLPPLLSILLDRCSKPEDIPSRLLSLRDEFEDIRLSIQGYITDVNRPGILKDQIEAAKEMKRAIDSLKTTLTKAKKSLIYQTWDVVKPGSPMKIFTGTIDLLIEKDIERQMVRRIHPFIDMWSLFFDVQDYGRLLVKVFGENRIDYDAFNKSEALSRSCEQFMFPIGREQSP